MTIEDILIQPGTGTVLGIMTTVMVGLNTLFFRWLTSSFTALKGDIKENATTYTKWLSSHEDKDQNRHEENLRRFEKISVSLAKLGSDNGIIH